MIEEPMKIPVEYLLKRSRQEVGELTSYIHELEYKIKEQKEHVRKLENIISSLKYKKKEYTLEVRKEELYKQIQETNMQLRKKHKQDKDTIANLIYQLTQLKKKYGD